MNEKTYCLTVKGKCNNCGAIVEEYRTPMFTSKEKASEYFKSERSYLTIRMNNHDCSEEEFGVVETLSYRMDIYI